jgi:hypothetical protein
VLIPLLFMGDVSAACSASSRSRWRSRSDLGGGVADADADDVRAAAAPRPDERSRPLLSRERRASSTRTIAALRRMLDWVLDRQPRRWWSPWLTLVLTGLLYDRDAEGLLPVQDTGASRHLRGAAVDLVRRRWRERQQRCARDRAGSEVASVRRSSAWTARTRT